MIKRKPMSQETKEKISKTMKKIGGNLGTWKKGQLAWNYEGKGKLKRKMKKFNGKLVLNSHYVFCRANNILKIPKGYVLHHEDGDSLNDNLNNLIFMTDKKHKQFHNQISKIIAGDKLK